MRRERSSQERNTRRLPPARRRLLGTLGLAAAGLASAFAISESIVWWFFPTEYLYPRYQVSPQYGLIPYPNVAMVHGVPRRFELRYSTNADRCRGENVAPASEAQRPAVAVLGDSYTFGMGVSDGEDYPAVMRRALGGRWTVLSLASPGWGLTQQIRRYYDLGEAYYPDVVVIQFGGNDPEDNIINPVTKVRDGEFVFVDGGHGLNWTKRLLARSVLQRSQLYNFARVRASRLLEAQRVKSGIEDQRRTMPGLVGSVTTRDSVRTMQERIYTDLLSTFARELSADGRTLVVIAINRHLTLFAHIEAVVRDLDAQGLLRYHEVLDWLEGMSDYGSPDPGHGWGAPAHAVIGERLAEVVLRIDEERRTPGGALSP